MKKTKPKSLTLHFSDYSEVNVKKFNDWFINELIKINEIRESESKKAKKKKGKKK